MTAWIVDETSFVKKGTHSVGVARQYCGRVGKKENCQVAVSLSVATATGSLPIAWRLYLPEEWANDPVRRTEADVPKQVQFQTKPQIALAQIRQAVEDRVPPGVVLADEVYGSSREFRDGVAELKLDYSLAVRSNDYGVGAGAAAFATQALERERAGGPHGCDGTRRTNRFRWSSWRRSCRRKHGVRWPGAKAVKKRCVPALPHCGSDPRTATIAKGAYSRNSGC